MQLVQKLAGGQSTLRFNEGMRARVVIETTKKSGKRMEL